MISSDEEGLRRRVAEVIRTFRDLRLEFSDSSLELVASPAARVPDGPWEAAGRVFARPPALSVLGVALDPTASTAAMLDHRQRAVEGDWSRHRAALSDRAASMAVRWRAPLALHGGE